MPHDDTNEDDRCLQQHVMVKPNITSHMPIGVCGFVFAVFLRTIIVGRARRKPGLNARTCRQGCHLRKQWSRNNNKLYPS